jgi:hypothetical protein
MNQQLAIYNPFIVTIYGGCIWALDFGEQLKLVVCALM